MEEYEILNKKMVANGYIILCHLPWNKVTPWATWLTPFDDMSKVEFGHFHRTEDAAKVDFSNRKF